MDKNRLLDEIFRLANGPRNFRLWLGDRATQFAETFPEQGPRADLVKRFMETGESKLAQWIRTVNEIYRRHFSDEEIETLYRELRLQREKYGYELDIPDEALSLQSLAAFQKAASLQPELDDAMHQLLPVIIKATLVTYQNRN